MLSNHKTYSMDQKGAELMKVKHFPRFPKILAFQSKFLQLLVEI